MDEGVGALAIGLILLAIAIWIITLILKLLAWIFVALTALVGHQWITLLVLTAVGAGAGLVVHHRKHGQPGSGSEDDFATLGPVRLTLRGWAILLLLTFFAGLPALVGMFFV